jgi:hypothetical protein
MMFIWTQKVIEKVTHLRWNSSFRDTQTEWKLERFISFSIISMKCHLPLVKFELSNHNAQIHSISTYKLYSVSFSHFKFLNSSPTRSYQKKIVITTTSSWSSFQHIAGFDLKRWCANNHNFLADPYRWICLTGQHSNGRFWMCDLTRFVYLNSIFQLIHISEWFRRKTESPLTLFPIGSKDDVTIPLSCLHFISDKATITSAYLFVMCPTTFPTIPALKSVSWTTAVPSKYALILVRFEWCLWLADPNRAERPSGAEHSWYWSALAFHPGRYTKGEVVLISPMRADRD